MSKKKSFENKKFRNVQEKLKHIQRECKEHDLFPYLQQLFKDMGYINVQITHGSTEYGKDLVFCEYDKKLKQEIWYAVIVKNKAATQNDFLPSNEIGVQIQTAFKVPHTTLKGEEKSISSVIVVINDKVTSNASEVLKNSYDAVAKNNIHIWSYTTLCEQFEEFSKESFLNSMEPHISHYQNTVIKELSQIQSNNLFDLNIKDINDIFVNVQTTYSKEVKKVNNYVSFEEDDEKLLKEDDIEGTNEILQSSHNFIIHGIPTSGKTLFLKRTGIKALSNPNNNIAVFYIELDKVEINKFDIEKFISAKYFEITKENFNYDDYEKVLLLFDSVDFISDVSKKENILKYVDKISSENNKFQIVLATRNLNYIQSNGALKDFKDTELLPFNLGQALQLVKKIIPNNEAKTNNFIEAIKDNLLDSSIQKTPLALTLLATLYRDDHVDLKELPANIYELYNKFTDIYLDRWDTTNGISQQYKYEQTKIIISFIANFIHCKGLNTIEVDELKKFLTELRKRYNYESLADIDNLVEFLKTKNNVFYFDESTKTFQFFNHYFQEFFASFALEDEEDSIFIDNFFNSWWHNALIFYAGKRPKSFRIHKAINGKILPLDTVQRLIYLSQHSKTLQASHSILIEQRDSVVKKLLFEFNELFKYLISEAKENPDAFLNQIPYVSVISQSKNLFDEFFGSTHIATSEVLDFFEQALESQDFELITRYNIAFFLANKRNDVFPLEYFSNIVLSVSDPTWTRIVYVDTNFLKYKKTINQKLYLKIKRKMTKNKFLIRYFMRNTINTNNKPIEAKDIKQSKIRKLR